MAKGERRRWLIWLSSLVLTIVAIAFGPAPAEVVEVAADRAQAVPVSAYPPAAAESTPVFVEEGVANPFEKRGWEEPPLSPPQIIEAASLTVSPLVAAPEEPKGPPPLPFKYVGRFSDDAGGLVYLARGDQTLVVRQGDTIGNSYRVTVVEARLIEFEHIESGTRQTLPVPEAE